MISLVDTHIHLDANDFVDIAAARQCGIEKFIVPGVDVSGWAGLVALAQISENVCLAPGLHPAYAGQWSVETGRQLRHLIDHPKVVALGEIGLDGTVAIPLAQQQTVLRHQLELALEVGLPVLLHARKATGMLLAILRELQVGKKIGGVWHGFSASLPVATELAELGIKIGIGPVLLRENCRKLTLAVEQLPETALVLETDYPDMAKKPEVLLAIAKKIAKLRGLTLAEVAQITTNNSNQLFSLQEK